LKTEGCAIVGCDDRFFGRGEFVVKTVGMDKARLIGLAREIQSLKERVAELEATLAATNERIAMLEQKIAAT